MLDPKRDLKGATMKEQWSKAEYPKATRKTKREQYTEDLKVISGRTTEEVTRAILSGAGTPKK